MKSQFYPKTSLAVISLLCPAVVCAQSAGVEGQADSAYGDIVVTAQKRSESVNRVPIAISVQTGADLRAAGVLTTQRLETTTTNFVFGNTNGFAQPTIRGISTDLLLPGQDSPVGFYVDGVYFPFQSSMIQQFGDVERVEVLKGPQGTLYGRNTTGGAINIVTRDPSAKPTADVSLSYGEYNYVKAVAYLSGGVAEGVSANITGFIARHDGTTKVINTGGRVDNLDTWGVRGKIKLEPIDTVSFVLSADYSHQKDRSNAAWSVLNPSDLTLSLPPGNGPSLTPRRIYMDPDNPFVGRNQRFYGFNFTSRVELGGVDFTSITGYRNDFMRAGADTDATAFPIQTFSSDLSSQQFTQELQLASASSTSPLQWIVGAFLLDSKGRYGPTLVWDNAPPATSVPGVVLDGATKIFSYAFFGQASYAITDTLKVIGGLRYSFERRKLSKNELNGFNLFDPAVRTAFGADPLVPSKSFHSTDPKITLQYENNHQLLYATFSTAFKSGAYNLGNPVAATPLEPEDMTAYEIGGKHRLSFLDMAQFNWSAFWYDYKNMQVSAVGVGGGLAGAQNAASARVKGIEGDIRLPVGDVVGLTFGAGYLDAKYRNFPIAAVYNIVNGVMISSNFTVPFDASGSRLNRAPKLTLTGQIDVKQSTSIGDFKFTASGYHNSGFNLYVGNNIKQKAYETVSLSLDFTPTDSPLTASVWVNNLFDEDIIGGVVPNAYMVGAGYQDPRIAGVTISAKF